MDESLVVIVIRHNGGEPGIVNEMLFYRGSMWVG
jgi:hypothetical protein